MGLFLLALTIVVLGWSSWIAANMPPHADPPAAFTLLLALWGITLSFYVIRLLWRLVMGTPEKRAKRTAKQQVEADRMRVMREELAQAKTRDATVSAKVVSAPPPMPKAGPAATSEQANQTTESKRRGCIGGLFYAVFWIIAIPFKVAWWMLSTMVSGSSSEGTSGGLSTAKLYSGGDTDKWWTWDGSTLRTYSGADTDRWWTWDGSTLRTYSGSNSDRWWTWDGSTLRLYSGGDSDRWMQLDGSTLKTYSGADSDRWWRFEGANVRPYSDGDQERWWVIEGSMPLPVMAKAIGAI